MITDQTSLEQRLRRQLTTAEVADLPQLDDEARFLIEGYTGGDYSVEVPPVVQAVVLRLVARALTIDPALEGVATTTEQAGSFQKSRTYSGGGSAMYLAQQEKNMLSRLRPGIGSLTLRNY